MKPKPKIILMKSFWKLETRGYIFSWHQVGDVLLIKYQTWGTGTKTALTLVQVLHRLSTIPSGISGYILLVTKYPVFLRSAFVLNASKSTSTLV